MWGPQIARISPSRQKENQGGSYSETSLRGKLEFFQQKEAKAAMVFSNEVGSESIFVSFVSFC
jgi:hypothetical protein